MKYCFDLSCEADTLALGVKIAENLKSGAFIALSGDLGAGKTVFVKGLAEGLGIRERVTSPTYTVMCQYFGKKELCHFDLYRITEDDCYSMGFDDFFYDESIVCAVEWSERLSSLPPHLLSVNIIKTGENSRRAEITVENGLFKKELS